MLSLMSTNDNDELTLQERLAWLRAKPTIQGAHALLADLSLEMPSVTDQKVLAALGRLGGRVRGQFASGGVTRVQAVMPVAQVRLLQQQLPGLSMGEGIVESRLDGYQPIGDNPPKRPRTRPSPLDRDAWLPSLTRRG